MKRVLYISYDGMTDPLGQSQVLPYIKGLSESGFQFTLISFEKAHRFTELKSEIADFCNSNNIDWVPLSFSSNPPVLSKIWDLYKLKKKVKALYESKKFDMVHCRSYVSAEGGYYLKKKYGVTFLFDIRGFWVDERVDGGLWNLKNPFYKSLYKFYKQKEKRFFIYADHVITLTEASKPYLQNNQKLNEQNISVIPCASDFDLFQIPTNDQMKRSRDKLGLDEEKLVISYLGSIGTWYLLDEMLLFFKRLVEKYESAVFLFITPEPADRILNSAKQLGLSTENIIIRKANRNAVFELMSASDLSVYFIKQCFSKISSSPTKLGEILAMGLPVITNTKIGDVDATILAEKNGYLVNDFTDYSFDQAIDQIDVLLDLDAEEIRQGAMKRYHLKNAVERYLNCYKKLLP